MAITPYKTFLPGEVLTAADLNASFAQILDNASLIGWPSTSNKDLDGYALILDTGGASYLQAAINNIASFTLSSHELFLFDGSVPTPVNGLRFVAGATGTGVELEAEGDDTDIDITLTPKGAGVVNIPTAALSIDASQVTSGTFADARISESSVTQHEGAIDHDALANFVSSEHIDWSVTGLQDIHADRIAEGSVTQHQAALSLDATQLTSGVLANARVQESNVTQHETALALAASQITSGTFADARISASSVTQHEAALEAVLDHDDLQGFVAQEHIRWDQTGAEDIHADRISQASVTQHQAALSLAASQITSGTFADARISESSVTQHEGALSIAAAQVGAGAFDLDGNSLTVDADGDTTINAGIDDILTLNTGGSLRAFISNSVFSSLLPLDMNGLQIDLDADNDTSITADTDDRIDFEVGGADRVQLSSSSMLLGVSLDMNANELILDADNDTSITSDTDDRIDFRAGGSDRLQLSASSALFAVDIDMDGNKIDLDADADTSIHASTDDQVDFEVGGVDRMALTSTVLSMGVPIDMNGQDIVLDSDADTYIDSPSDDVIDIYTKGIVGFRIDGDATSPLYGLTVQTAASGNSVAVFPHGGATVNLSLLSIGSSSQIGIAGGAAVNLSASNGDVFIQGAPYKQARLSTSTGQTISNTTNTNLTNLTGLTLPNTTTVSSKSFRVTGVVQVVDNAVATRLVTIRLYNGSNGTNADTLVGTWNQVVAALASETIAIDLTFTPGADTRTKVGLSAQLSSASSTIFNNSVVSTLQAVQVIE